MDVYCLDECSMFSWQSFFGEIASCLAMTDRMRDCFVPRNDETTRNDGHNWNDGTSFLRHCEKT